MYCFCKDHVLMHVDENLQIVLFYVVIYVSC